MHKYIDLSVMCYSSCDMILQRVVMNLFSWGKYIKKSGIKFFYIVFYSRYKFEFSEPVSHKMLADELGVSLAVTSFALAYFTEQGYLESKKTLSKHGKYVYAYRCTDLIKNEVDNSVATNKFAYLIKRILGTSYDIQQNKKKRDSLSYSNRLLLAIMFTYSDSNGVMKKVGTDTLYLYAGRSKNSFREQIKKLIRLKYLRQFTKGFSSKTYGKLAGQYVLNIDHPVFKEGLFQPPDSYYRYFIYKAGFISFENNISESWSIISNFRKVIKVKQEILEYLKYFNLNPKQGVDELVFQNCKIEDFMMLRKFLIGQTPKTPKSNSRRRVNLMPLIPDKKLELEDILIRIPNQVKSSFVCFPPNYFLNKIFRGLSSEVIHAISATHLHESNANANSDEVHNLQVVLEIYASEILTELWLKPPNELKDLHYENSVKESIKIQLIPKKVIQKHTDALINEIVDFYFKIVSSMAIKYRGLLLELFKAGDFDLPCISEKTSILIVPPPKNKDIRDSVVFQLTPSFFPNHRNSTDTGTHLFDGLMDERSNYDDLGVCQYGKITKQANRTLTTQDFYDLGLLSRG